MEYRNPKFNCDGNIDCEVNHPQYGWVPFTAVKNDTGALFDVNEMIDQMISVGGIEPYVPPSQEELNAQAALNARNMRDCFLQTIVDPVVSNPLRWYELTPEKQTEWAAYRRSLLDIPEQAGFPSDITWPEQP